MSGNNPPAQVEASPAGGLSTLEQQQVIDGSDTATPPARVGTANNQGYGPPPTPPQTTRVRNGIEAALQKLIERATADSVEREFNRQRRLQQNYSSADAQAFWEENITHMGKIRVFGAMKEGSQFVQVYWGLGKYTDEDNAGDVGDGVLCFVGNRNRFGDTPSMVALPKENSFKWKKVAGLWDASEFTQHYGDDNNRLRLRTPPPVAPEEKMLPRVLYLPLELGAFVATKPRTCYELYEEALRLAGEDSSMINAEHIELVKDWCIGATFKAAENSSTLALKTTPVASDTEVFTEWKEDKCNWFLGHRTEGQQGNDSSPASFDQRFEQMASSLLTKAMETNMEMATRLNAAQQSGAGSGQSSSNPLSGVKALEGAELYAVMGFCGITDPSLVPPIWRTYYNANASILTKRQEIDDQLQEWSLESGYPVNKMIRLSKDWFTDVKAVDLAKGEARASWELLDRGFSAQCARAVTVEYNAKMTAKETAEEETAHTRTLAERLALSRNDPRPPPETLDDLKLDLATYAGLTFIHFGKLCDLYRGLVAVRDALESHAVEQVKHCYNTRIVLEYWFEVLDKSRLYFFSNLRKTDFAQLGGPTYPTCTLSSLLQPIYAGRGVENCAFPAKWRNAVPTAPRAGSTHGLGGMQWNGAGARSVSFGAYNQVMGGGATGGYGYDGLGVGRQARSPTPPPAPARVPSAPPDNRTPPSFGESKVAHCHPTVRQEFADYHKMYGGVPRIKELCKHSKVKQSCSWCMH